MREVRSLYRGRYDGCTMRIVGNALQPPSGDDQDRPRQTPAWTAEILVRLNQGVRPNLGWAHLAWLLAHRPPWTSSIYFSGFWVDSRDAIQFVQEHIIYRFGIPQNITTDQGSIFVSDEFV